MEWWLSAQDGSLYIGDCRSGDRAASADEIAAWQAKSAVPPQVSDRQFFQGAAQAGLISQAEALAMMQTGAIPAALAAAVGTLPAEQQFAAKMAIIGNRVFARADALVASLGAAMGQTPAQIDALFTLAATL
jgi:hypothetical protein